MESTTNNEVELKTGLHGRLLFTARLAWLLFTLTCSLSTLSLVFLALSWETHLPDMWGFRGDAVLFALAFSSIGLLLARRLQQNPIGWLLITAGLFCAILELCIQFAAYTLLTKPGTLPGGALAAWIASWLWFIAIAMLIYTFLLFPTGHLPSVRWRPVGWFTVVAFAVTTLSFMIQPGPLYFAPYLDNPFAVQTIYRALNPLQIAFASAVLLIGLSLLLRLLRAEGVERQQLKWFAYAATLITLIGMTDSLASAAGLLGRDPKFYQYLTVAIWTAIPCAIAFSILRYRLWDIDIIISRTLVYGTLSAVIVTLYILLVGTLSLLSQTTGNLFISLLVTGLIAFLIQPLRERLQSSVNRLLYGDRDDPYAALSRLGRRLEASLGPETVLSTIVTTVRDALKLPYTAIYLKQQDDEYKIIAESASPTLHAENGKVRVPGIEREGQCIPLIHQGETLGYLVLGPRTPNEAFTSSDLRLVDDLAPQVGVAVHAVRLTSDLQRSREQLVLTREEERRRLRRDLHDGLGPNLASQGLKLAAVKQLLENNPTAALPLLDQVMEQNNSTVADVRRLVYGLRPPALDELGLVAAIRDHVAGMVGKSTLQIEISEPSDHLPPLSAAVEVAAYRIVLEALTNVIRHAQAKHCAIRFSVSRNASSDILGIEIQDDGKGMPLDHRAGVGLRSMRERAEEIGGTCVVESNERQGTCVSVRVPLITM
jgi:signal transduction histidine kinase